MHGLDEICQKVRISDYLEKEGIELVRAGAKVKCSCPLPDHPDDNTPSFHIGEFDDGAEYFKCFGCGASGNIISLIRMMEGKTNRDVVKQLSRETGVELGDYSRMAKIEPMPEDVLRMFCEEEDNERELSNYVWVYLRDHNGSTDAVNKVSRLYEKLDKLVAAGDANGIHQITKDMIELIIRDKGKRK